ncbi:hypothetical protein DPEC_G00134290 [Dallia pectoralis]|uniref:Uncharacterized protein n=2 Tax=Dallia pectoralis TaxID=75939 RepID=A0ACC2GRS4_DALPE|nr:hypothetical protein DPEC_G00134190 [Dallia pectoralis]KAJ8006347.1 hypothetical protein DPEC_G00134290 [Dallia pectoralis]
MEREEEEEEERDEEGEYVDGVCEKEKEQGEVFEDITEDEVEEDEMEQAGGGVDRGEDGGGGMEMELARAEGSKRGRGAEKKAEEKRTRWAAKQREEGDEEVKVGRGGRREEEEEGTFSRAKTVVQRLNAKRRAEKDREREERIKGPRSGM